MAKRLSFISCDNFKLDGVTVTERELGHGSYANVLELEYLGLKCAGKKIHETLFNQGNHGYIIRRFEQECSLLSQVRHPNIVQFLGVYAQQNKELPILVMEYLPATLVSTIDHYGIMPQDTCYSILHDVALGLCYLHSQTPPIIHRDLSSNNVLLTANMTAKIADLGVARILDISPVQVSHMTQMPGTPAFMPPEVMVANPSYDTSVDQFSYGVMMIHVLCGQWPDPQLGPTQSKRGKLTPVSEAERRHGFLQVIGKDHPLMDLILTCIDNDPERRARASTVVKRLGRIVSAFPSSFESLKMKKRIEANEEENRILREEMKERQDVIKRKEEEVVRLKGSIGKQTELDKSSKERLRVVHTLETKELKSQIKRLQTDLDATKTEKKAAIKENVTLETKLTERLEEHHESIQNVSTSFQSSLQQLEADFQASLSEERERSLLLLVEEKRRGDKERKQLQASLEKVVNHVKTLQVKAARVKAENEALKSTNSSLEELVATKDAKIKRNGEEIELKQSLLREMDATNSSLIQELTTAREFLASHKQSPQVSIAWDKCADLPLATASGQCTVVSGKVYFAAGGLTEEDSKKSLVYCYRPTEDQWGTLPHLPVKCFGLGQLNGKLVTVGGMKRDGKKRCDVFTFESSKWRTTIPPAALARTLPVVANNDRVLVVAGGYIEGEEDTSEVEIYCQDTSQWQRAPSLPTPCRSLSLVMSAEGDMLYALGGYDQPSKCNQVLRISIDDLLHGLDDDQKKSVWKTVQPSPNDQSTAGMLYGNLLSMGSWRASERNIAINRIYMYSPTADSWTYFGNLPEVCAWSTCASLSSTEILLVGGKNRENVVTTYKGTLKVEA